MESMRAKGLAWMLVAASVTAQEWVPLRVRHSGSCAFDVARQRTVQFDAFRGTAEYDGERWRVVTTAHAPSPRARPLLAYDLLRFRVVLVGGQNGQDLRDTWEYDGRDWREVPGALLPAGVAEGNAAAAYDATRARLVLLHLDRTLEYDGTRWLSIAVPHRPPARLSPALASLGDGRTLLFGGEDPTSQYYPPYFDDTWVYDGSDWSPVATAVAPEARGSHRMAYDAGRDRVVLYGGVTVDGAAPPIAWEFHRGAWHAVPQAEGPPGASQMVYAWGRGGVEVVLDRPDDEPEVWRFDGGAWTRDREADFPSARNGHSMVFDPVRRTTWLVGGFSSATLDYTWFGDTWAFARGRWWPVQTSGLPGGRRGAGAAFDPTTGNTILFGGMTDIWWPTGETWSFDGTRWTLLPQANAPFARAGHAMATDFGRRRIVLFGGTAGLSLTLADTWEFDGSRWQQMAPVESPSPYGECTMTYDAGAARVLAYAGADWAPGGRGTWSYDGVTWRRVPGADQPATPLSAFAMTYDAHRGRAQLLTDALWEFDGRRWQQLAPSEAGPRLEQFTFVWTADDGTQRFGGSFYGSPPIGDHWQWRPSPHSTWTRRGAGCARAGFVPTLDAAAPPASVLGAVHEVRLAAGDADLAVVVTGLDPIQWNGTALPVSLLPSAPQCKLWIAPELGARLLPLQGGRGVVPLAIPADPALAGGVLCLQALTFDSALGAASLATSNAGVLRTH
ncbi:MAG: hypothetical protein AB7O97_06430 [Planctomycetota bacterium]